ncbi:MAG: GspE/PulE family protein [Puniceicoccaceae bacterium]
MQRREAFAYESNAPLLRQYLVPEPFTGNEWDSCLKDWRSSGKARSFLEWLIIEEKIAEDCLLEYLSLTSGSKANSGQFSPKSIEQTPESELLEKLGFLPLGRNNGVFHVAGGPDIAPDLFKCLGQAAENWQWVLISPIREPGVPDISATINPATETGLKQILLGFWSRDVTDVHFERVDDCLQIRIHESGTMRTVDTWTGETVEASIRLLKTWAGLSTATDSLPQDGRLSIDISSGPIELRVSHISTVNGESIVLRNPSWQSRPRVMEDLGIPYELNRKMTDVVRHHPGLIIISGPTGSGKTTTAYALLNQLHGDNRKIISIEDPVEQELPHAVQCEVNLNTGWTFDQAVRAFLRQDPDIIFLGEMRDGESAGAAFRAALTGHCVVATLHASSNSAALDRMISWSIPEGMLKETIRLMVNQRLLQDPQTKQIEAEFKWQTNTDPVTQAV